MISYLYLILCEQSKLYEICYKENLNKEPY